MCSLSNKTDDLAKNKKKNNQNKINAFLRKKKKQQQICVSLSAEEISSDVIKTLSMNLYEV